ncbi:STAS/SEC14 domain-containing protein [Sphingomonas sp. 4RDLI-65]|uniref:STAS/SEC14 domain-containing protein n=1 Tax=Sphingomonas sp. 4RDLI-65 TaxID=3111641 RepID=UPI003C16A308
MTPRFEIVADPKLDLVTITMGGFFAQPDIDAFEQARDVAHRELRCGPNEHVTLVDIREMLIQSQAAIEGFQRVLNNHATKSKRIAIVTSKTLARMQVERAAERRDVGYFSGEPSEAKKWLLAG